MNQWGDIFLPITIAIFGWLMERLIIKSKFTNCYVFAEFWGNSF